MEITPIFPTKRFLVLGEHKVKVEVDVIPIHN
jgi:hypothetical protein